MHNSVPVSAIKSCLELVIINAIEAKRYSFQAVQTFCTSLTDVIGYRLELLCACVQVIKFLKVNDFRKILFVFKENTVNISHSGQFS